MDNQVRDALGPKGLSLDALELAYAYGALLIRVDELIKGAQAGRVALIESQKAIKKNTMGWPYIGRIIGEAEAELQKQIESMAEYTNSPTRKKALNRPPPVAPTKASPDDKGHIPKPYRDRTACAECGLLLPAKAECKGRAKIVLHEATTKASPEDVALIESLQDRLDSWEKLCGPLFDFGQRNSEKLGIKLGQSITQYLMEMMKQKASTGEQPESGRDAAQPLPESGKPADLAPVAPPVASKCPAESDRGYREATAPKQIWYGEEREHPKCIWSYGGFVHESDPREKTPSIEDACKYVRFDLATPSGETCGSSKDQLLHEQFSQPPVETADPKDGGQAPEVKL